jgi:hypothetical protein
MGLMALMGRIIIVVSIIAFPVSLFLILSFSDLLGFTEVVALILASLFFLAGGIYAGVLGVKTEELSSMIDSLLEPRKTAPAGNVIKAVCPVDNRQAIFVHVTPHRSDAKPDGRDLFVGSCGHEVHREQIQLKH